MSGKNLIKAWHKFLQSNFNYFQRGGPNLHKDRKYEHIEIQKDFEDIEKKRKLERLSLIEYKKKLKQQLLQQQLEVSKKESPELIDKADPHLSQEIKMAEQIAKTSESKTAQEFMKKAREAQQISTAKDRSTQEIEKEIAQIGADLERIRSTKKELETVEKQIEELEPGYMIVSGIDKKMVLNAIAYYEFQQRNLQGVLMHPETQKSIETVHYHVEHNLPVRRDLLYEVVPELFQTEIGELEEYEKERIQAKRPRFINKDDAIVRAVEETPEERSQEPDFFDQLKREEMEMMNFVYKKAGEFTMKYYEHIDQKLNSGFPTMEAVLENIDTKQPNERTEIEKEMYEGLLELKQINQDYADLINLNKAKAVAKQKELYIPDFIAQNEKLKKVWIEKWEQIVATSFDLSDSWLVPDNSANYESQLDRVLKEQRAQDIYELINQSNQEYKEKVSGSEPVALDKRDQKDQNLLQKLDVLTGAMHQKPERKAKSKTRKIEHFQARIGAEMAEEGRILLDEYTKVLYLNNRDPNKYNLTYWAEHFNIEPQKLRNIFNFVSYGVPDKNSPKDIGRVLRFIYDPEAVPEMHKQKLKEM